MGSAEGDKMLRIRGELFLTISLGLYFAWTSGSHYATLFGFSPQGEAFLSSLASISSAVLYAVIFLRCRRNLPVLFSGRNNAIVLVLGLCGMAMKSIDSLHVIAPVLIGIWVAWYRLAFVIHLVSLPRRSIIRCVGNAFFVCSLILYDILFAPSGFSTVAFYTILLLLFFGLALLKKTHDCELVEEHRFVPFGSLWKIALFSFSFSFLFDVTEIHLFFRQQEFVVYGIPLGFIGVATIAYVLSTLLPSKKNLFDGFAFTLAVMLACVVSTSFFVSDIVAAPLLQTIVQITCGYGFVSLLIVLVAEISKRYSVPPCMLFSLVFCIQRIGNYLGELVGFGFMVNNRFSPELMDAIAGIAIVLCFSFVLIVFVSMNGKLTLYEKGLIGAGNDDEYDSQVITMRNVARMHSLTERETDVFLLIVNRYSRKEMERELFLSGNTIKTHTQNIYRKFEVHSRTELIEMVMGISSESLL